MQPHVPFHLKLFITIVDRDKGQLAVNVMLKEGVLFHRILRGRGTAQSEILDLLGLGDTPKDIIFSIVPSFKVKRLMFRLRKTLEIDNPGHGIAFAIPVNSVAGQRTLKHLSGHHHDEVTDNTAQKETKMETKHYDLIITIVNHGYSDNVMDAARLVGARGGTVLHARGAGIKEAEKFFGITIQPEKEMVFILTRAQERHAIMEAICAQCGINTEAHGIVFSLPVEEAMGVASILREDEEEELEEL